MQTVLPNPANSALRESLRALHTRLTGRVLEECRFLFYPYAGLHHTIRWRDGGVELRLSDILQDAPFEVLQAIALKLLYKLLGRRPPRDLVQKYRDYINRSEIVERTRQVRGSRGRKRLNHPRGRVFDLEELFQDLNTQYFEGQLSVERLGWSRGRGLGILGHYDPAHSAIVISTRLDNPLVPRYVVAYVLYHEMLHVSLGEKVRNGRRHVHHREFRLAERRFRDFQKAKRFIGTHFSHGR